jgi:NAD(P)-dependent dehydrogenase (short-subunit alcohol dehydrogenase family)
MDEMRYREKSVLVTGGTKGIGLAIGIEFARHGADVWLTHRWGSVDEADVVRAFEQAGVASRPHVVLADVANDEDTEALLRTMREQTDHVEAFVSNVAFAQVVRSMEDYRRRSFTRSIEYGAWPLVAYPQKMMEVFGRYPRYVLGISSFGAATYHPNYDFAALSKAVMETMVRYLALRLRPHGTTVNALRPWVLRTDSSLATFGETMADLCEHYLPDGAFLEPQQVAKAAYGFCSGYFDHVSGQVLSVDGGCAFRDNLMGLLERPDVLEALSSLAKKEA